MESGIGFGRSPAVEFILPAVEAQRAGRVQSRNHERYTYALVACHQVRDFDGNHGRER